MVSSHNKRKTAVPPSGAEKIHDAFTSIVGRLKREAWERNTGPMTMKNPIWPGYEWEPFPHYPTHRWRRIRALEKRRVMVIEYEAPDSGTFGKHDHPEFMESAVFFAERGTVHFGERNNKHLEDGKCYDVPIGEEHDLSWVGPMSLMLFFHPVDDDGEEWVANWLDDEGDGE
jgi:quercetin dioxygenase-like cupin family protein